MSRVITLTSPSGATLKTKNKYVDDDIAVQVSGGENITANNIKSGVTILGVAGTLPPAPSGTLQITENGTYDVSGYENVTVEIGGGKMYKHECYAFNVYFKISIIKTLYSSSATPFSIYNFGDYIYPANSRCELTGTISINNVLYPLIYSNLDNIYYLKDGKLISNQRVSGSQIDAFYDTVTDMTNI